MDVDRSSPKPEKSWGRYSSPTPMQGGGSPGEGSKATVTLMNVIQKKVKQRQTLSHIAG